MERFGLDVESVSTLSYALGSENAAQQSPEYDLKKAQAMRSVIDWDLYVPSFSLESLTLNPFWTSSQSCKR